jgi:hypothetical protein
MTRHSPTNKNLRNFRSTDASLEGREELILGVAAGVITLPEYFGLEGRRIAAELGWRETPGKAEKSDAATLAAVVPARSTNTAAAKGPCSRKGERTIDRFSATARSVISHFCREARLTFFAKLRAPHRWIP